MDSAGYLKHLEEDILLYEARCKRCGACCGAGGSDSCANLKKDAGGIYSCSIYEKRFGVQVTVSGRSFMCVAIRDVLKYSQPTIDCGYAK